MSGTPWVKAERKKLFMNMFQFRSSFKGQIKKKKKSGEKETDKMI